MKNNSLKFFYFIAGISGACVLIVEIAGARLLTPFFGASVFIWTSAISVTLAALAIGYFIGATISKREDIKKELSNAFFFASICTFLIPYFVYVIGNILPVIYRGNIPSGGAFFLIFSASLIVLMPACIFYGFVSPLIIELLGRDGHHPGTISGKVFAISTIGSIIGSILTPIVFYPIIGTHITFISVALIVMLLSIVVEKSNRWKKVILILLLILIGFGLKPNPLKGPGIVFGKETPYQTIRLIEDEEKFSIIFNEGLGVQSVHQKGTPWTGRYWDWLAILPFIHGGENLNTAVLGFAGGTIPRIWRETPAAQFVSEIDGVDIDPAVFDLVKNYFDEDLFNVNPVIADGRQFLASTDSTYDLLLVDAYANEFQIPFHMATIEFFQLAQSRLNPEGILAFNIALGHETELAERLIATTNKVFANVYLLHTEIGSNSLIFASDTEIDFDDLNQIYEDSEMPFPPYFSIKKITDTSVKLFTDDKAPLELLTDLSIF